MMTWRAFFGWLREAVAVVRIIAVPLSGSIFAALILAFPEQMREHYRLLIDDLLYDPLFRKDYSELAMHAWIIIASLLGVLALAAGIAVATRLVLSVRACDYPADAPFWSGVNRWAPAVLGALPLVALAAGIALSVATVRYSAAEAYLAMAKKNKSNLAGAVSGLIAWETFAKNWLLITFSVVLIAAIAFLLIYRFAIDARAAGASSSPAISARTLGWPSAMAASLVVAFLQSRVSLPQLIGSIALFSLFVLIVVTIGSRLGLLSRVVGVPLMGCLVSGALFFSILDWNDNHVLRRIDREGRPVSVTPEMTTFQPELASLEDSLVTWYESRADRGDPAFVDKRYPVYIVAAQGGGIYAAAQTLLFLTRMQESCERFTQHLFAISGVSGGSIGATLYSSMASMFKPHTEACAEPGKGTAVASAEISRVINASYNLLQKDYLSPLLAGTLFPDFLQRFLPFSVPAWSRALPLERAFEDALDEMAAKYRLGFDAQSNPMRRGLLHSWNPGGVRPALVLNATETASGRRRVLAAFRFGESSDNDLRFFPLAPDRDVKLSSAAVASARFPWLTPAAWFWGARADGSGAKFRIVDGGFFENSGVATAVDLIDSLETIAAKRNLPIEVHLIAMTSGGYPQEDRFLGLSELLSPVMSLLNTRRARTRTTLELADRRLGLIAPSDSPGMPQAPVQRLQRVGLHDLINPLPLGWRLSEAAVFQIFVQVGVIAHCTPDSHFRQTEPGATSADCVKRLIQHQLRGDDLAKVLSTATAPPLPAAVPP